MPWTDSLVGTEIVEQRFRLDRVVSEGGEHAVVEGHDVFTDAPVVVRIAKAPRGLSQEELSDGEETFDAEAHTLRRIGEASSSVERLVLHANITGPDRERLSVTVFERPPGKPLSELLARGPVPLARALELLKPVAEALTTAHSLGGWHGDVRLENVLVVDEAAEPPKMLLRGFTLATRVGPSARTFAPEYGAPEHFQRGKGEGAVGPQTDTYGLALCVVALVIGRPPLEGNAAELYRQATDIMTRPTFRARGARVATSVEAVIARAVAVNPKLRPPMRDFWSALESAVAEAGPIEIPSNAPAPAAPATTRLSPNRKLAIAGSIGVLAALLVVSAGSCLFKRPPASADGGAPSASTIPPRR